jgi:hypothetical protein
MTQLHFLESPVALTKTFAKRGSEIVKTPYPFVWEFTSIDEQVTSLADFMARLKTHAQQGHCLLKGSINKPLVNESRAGSTSTNDMTEWAVLDLDGITAKSVDEVLDAIGLKDTSYILQWSAGYGIENKELRAHLFFLLDRPVMAPLLKQWLIHLNHATPMLSQSFALTRTGCALKWPLDISACQNDKLLYIAPPMLKGIPDPVKADRIKLVKKANDRLKIAGSFSADRNKVMTDKKVAELREATNLPKRAFKYKMQGSQEIMLKPGEATITEMKAERGFVYFNLNGGDSWAYYHPESNPEFILNFKGEPAYLTKELLPEYWSDLMSRSANVATVLSDGKMHMAFCDKRTSSYFIGEYIPADDSLEVFPAKNATQVRDYAKQVGLPIGDFIPVWDLRFDPHDNVRVDPGNKVINTFNPSPYAKAVAVKRTAPPKTILKVITHALGHPQQEVVDHFMNWCAYIVQKRDRTKTAWVLHGVEGTGKGILCNNILRPILGMSNTTARRMEELGEIYNHYMKNSLLVVVDEVQTSALQNERGVMAKIRNFIADPMVPIRAMYSNGVEFPNYSNWIFNSNMPDPVSIPKNDRRHNVGKYQTQRLVITQKEIDQIERELQHFHDFLLYYPLDEEKASQIIITPDRETMISISETSIDTVASHLLEGDFEFFMDQMPAGVVGNSTDWKRQARIDDYRELLRAFIFRTQQATHPRNIGCSISREELQSLFDFVIGSMPNTPNKFTSLLKHHRIHMSKVWLDNKSVAGIKVIWKDDAHFPKYLAQLTKPNVVPITAAKGAAKKAA